MTRTRRKYLIEGKETIEPQILDEVAKALKVPVEAIKNFDEEKANNFSIHFTITVHLIINVELTRLIKWLSCMKD